MLRRVTEAGRLGKRSWAHRKQPPKGQLPCLQGSPDAASIAKGLGLQGKANPRLTGQPWSVGRGRLLLPHSSAHNRLPVEHKGSCPQNLVTGGATTPTEPQSLVSPPAAGTTLSSQAEGRHGQMPRSGSQPSFQGGSKPNLTSIYPPDYRGSPLRTQLIKHCRHTQPRLRDGAQHLTIAKKPHRAHSSHQSLSYRPARPAETQHNIMPFGAQGTTSTHRAGRSPHLQAEPQPAL